MPVSSPAIAVSRLQWPNPSLCRRFLRIAQSLIVVVDAEKQGANLLADASTA